MEQHIAPYALSTLNSNGPGIISTQQQQTSAEPAGPENNDLNAAAGPSTLTPIQEATLRRGAIACRRCRRARSKCINDNGEPPCRACLQNGKADECVFIKGNSIIDRKDAPRKKRGQDDNPAADPPSQSRKKRRRVTQPRQQSLSNNDRSFSYQGEGSAPASSNLGDQEEWVAAGQAEIEVEEEEEDESDEESEEAEEVVEQVRAQAPRRKKVVVGRPSQAEFEEAIEIYFRSFYQVGFLHKSSFTTKVQTQPHTISTFLIYAILSLTAGSSPTLVARHGNPTAAKRAYKSAAMAMISTQCSQPSVECIQAFYLLALNDWGSGFGSRSWMLIGMGLRMVELLRLDRHETYKHISQNSTEEEQIAAESSRRTVWSLLIADDSLVVGDGASSTAKFDVTIQLPCDEDDWEFASIPTHMTRESASKSLMGNTVSVMSLWCRAARRAAGLRTREDATPPWTVKGEYLEINSNLLDFMGDLSPRLRFTASSLAAHRNRKTDMALTHLHLIYHATHILLRRMYLPTMLAALDPQAFPGSQGYIANVAPPADFWKECAAVTFKSAIQVITIAQQYSVGKEDMYPKGFTPLMGFIIFLGGTMTSYLWRWPYLYPDGANEAQAKTTAALHIISSLVPDMIMARRWNAMLQQAYNAASDPDINQDVSGFEQTPGVPSASPSQIDPLGALADIAVSMPLKAQTQPGELQPTIFDNFEFFTGDFGDVFPFLQTDFTGAM